MNDKEFSADRNLQEILRAVTRFAASGFGAAGDITCLPRIRATEGLVAPCTRRSTTRVSQL